MGIDAAGFANDVTHQLAEAAPLYELEGFCLGRAIKAAASRDAEFANELDVPDLEHASRWMVSLYLWREYLFGNQAALGGPSYSSDASAFAYHTAQAFTILLRPWVEGGIRMRPRMLRRWVNDLDRITNEIIRVRHAHLTGELSELARWDVAGGHPQLMEQLKVFQDQKRDDGVSEAEIAAMIRVGATDDDSHSDSAGRDQPAESGQV